MYITVTDVQRAKNALDVARQAINHGEEEVQTFASEAQSAIDRARNA